MVSTPLGPSPYEGHPLGSEAGPKRSHRGAEIHSVGVVGRGDDAGLVWSLDMTNSRKKLAKKISKKAGVSHQGATNMMRRVRSSDESPPTGILFDHLTRGRQPIYDIAYDRPVSCLTKIESRSDEKAFIHFDEVWNDIGSDGGLVLPLVTGVPLPAARRIMARHEDGSLIYAWRRNHGDRLKFDLAVARVPHLPGEKMDTPPLWLRSPVPRINQVLSFLGSDELRVVKEINQDENFWVADNFWYRGECVHYPLDEIATHWVERYPIEVTDETGERRTDYPTSFPKMLDQIQDFCREHPNHDLMAADEPRELRMGWSSYHRDDFHERGDYPTRHWTITLSSAVHWRYWPDNTPSDFSDLLRTAKGRVEITNRLKEGSLWSLVPPEGFHPSEEEALKAVKALLAEEPSRTFIPCDNPELGLYGVVGVLMGDEEDPRHFWWPVEGKVPLRPVRKYLRTLDELEAFVEESGEVHSCDNPKRLTVGIVRYNFERGEAEARYMTLRALRDSTNSAKRWDALRARRSTRFSDHREAVTKLIASFTSVPEVVNPEAIGDPEQDPMVKLPEESILEFLDRTVEVEKVGPAGPLVKTSPVYPQVEPAGADVRGEMGFFQAHPEFCLDKDSWKPGLPFIVEVNDVYDRGMHRVIVLWAADPDISYEMTNVDFWDVETTQGERWDYALGAVLKSYEDHLVVKTFKGKFPGEMEPGERAKIKLPHWHRNTHGVWEPFEDIGRRIPFDRQKWIRELEDLEGVTWDEYKGISVGKIAAILGESRRKSLARMGKSDSIPFDERTPDILHENLDPFQMVESVRHLRREGWDVEVNNNEKHRTIGFRAEKDGRLHHWKRRLVQVQLDGVQRSTHAEKYFMDLFRWTTGRQALIKSDNVADLYEYLKNAKPATFDYTLVDETKALTYEYFDEMAGEILAVLRGERETLDETHMSDEDIEEARRQAQALKEGIPFDLDWREGVQHYLLRDDLRNRVQAATQKAGLMPSTKISLIFENEDGTIWGHDAEFVDRDLDWYTTMQELRRQPDVVHRAWQMHRNHIQRGTYPGPFPYSEPLPTDDPMKALKDRNEWAEKGVFEKFGKPTRLVVRVRPDKEGDRPWNS